LGNLEYLIILVPVFFAILMIFYFIYHLWHTEKYSKHVLRLIARKIEELEVSKFETSVKIKKLIDDFKRASSQKRIHLFDLERQIGIDMASFNTKLDKALKKDFSKKDQKKKIQLRFY